MHFGRFASGECSNNRCSRIAIKYLSIQSLCTDTSIRRTPGIGPFPTLFYGMLRLLNSSKKTLQGRTAGAGFNRVHHRNNYLTEEERDTSRLTNIVPLTTIVNRLILSTNNNLLFIMRK